MKISKEFEVNLLTEFSLSVEYNISHITNNNGEHSINFIFYKNKNCPLNVKIVDLLI